MDVWSARFTQTQIAQATGVSRVKMAMWVSRGHIKYVETDGDEGNGGGGLGHKLSARTALRFAIMDYLSPFIPPSQAEAAVTKFVDTGQGATPANPLKRDGGGLFETDEPGETILCVFADRKPEVFFKRPGEEIEADRLGVPYARFPMDELVSTVLRRLERMPAAETVSRAKPKREKINA